MFPLKILWGRVTPKSQALPQILKEKNSGDIRHSLTKCSGHLLQDLLVRGFSYSKPQACPLLASGSPGSEGEGGVKTEPRGCGKEKLVLEVDRWSQRGLGGQARRGWSPKNLPVSRREQPSGNAGYVPCLEAGRERERKGPSEVPPSP